MSFIPDNTDAIPISAGIRDYVCPICFRKFYISQGFAGHSKAHRHGRRKPYTHRRSYYRRKRPSIAPYPLPIPRVPPMSARGSVTNYGPGDGDDVVYAPNPLSVYYPFAHYYVASNYVPEGYFHAEKYVTYDFMGVNQSDGSYEGTFSGTEVISEEENVEEEFDLELRL